MAAQAKLTKEEVNECLARPRSVSATGRRLRLRRGRIEIIVQRWSKGWYLITVKWADPEMKLLHPREDTDA